VPRPLKREYRFYTALELSHCEGGSNTRFHSVLEALGANFQVVRPGAEYRNILLVLEFCPGGQRQILTVNKSILFV